LGSRQEENDFIITTP